MNEQASKEALIAFLSEFPDLGRNTVATLADLIPTIAPKQGTILLKEGEMQKECYFVLQGLVRQYQLVDGTERTTEFYSEANGTISSVHYSDRTPSTFSLECMEDCLLIAGNMEIDAAHYDQFPALVNITKNMLEKDLNEAKKKHTLFILSSPKERYLQFLESRPDLRNRVPLHQIASYLGMTPESLSRIRKRIVTSSE